MSKNNKTKKRKSARETLDIGGGLRRLRLAKGLGLTEVGALAGTDAGNLSRMERNTQMISFGLLIRVCGALEMDIADFLRYVRRWQGIKPDYRGRGKARRLVTRAESLLDVFSSVCERDQKLLLDLARHMERTNNASTSPPA